MRRKMENGFHPGKCNALCVARNRNVIKFIYALIVIPSSHYQNMLVQQSEKTHSGKAMYITSVRKPLKHVDILTSIRPSKRDNLLRSN